MNNKLDNKPLTIMSGLSSKRRSEINYNDPEQCFGSEHIYSTPIGHMHLMQVPMREQIRMAGHT